MIATALAFRKKTAVKTSAQALLTPALLLLLSGCTLVRPPEVRGLPDRNSIQAGQEIIVGQNQNVYGLARKYGVSMREVIVLNDLQPPFTLHPGQRLLLPAQQQEYAPIPSAAPVGDIEKRPLDSANEAAPGGPLNASPSSVETATLEPPAQPPAQVQSHPQALPPSTAKTPAPVADPLLQPPVPEPKPVTTTVASASSKPVALTKTAGISAQASPEAAATGTPTKETPDFLWPVQGTVLSSFGPKNQGTNNDGVNIGAPKGSPVQAAAGGIVVYAGNEMKGLGNLVLIRHEGGWVTAYAHLDRMLVSRDNVVAPGDMIGTVGSTGNVSAPQVHFETRLDGKAIDPQTVVKKS